MNPDDQLYVDKKLAEFEVALLRATKPPWNVIVSLIGIGIAIVSGAYTIIVIPLNERISKLERKLDANTETLKEDRELFKQYHDLPKR